MKWTEAIEWLKDHNGECQFQQIGDLDITVYWNGYYWTASGKYLDLPKICAELDAAIKRDDEGYRRDYRL